MYKRQVYASVKVGKSFIYFQGVESCYYVYVNGKEVGYSEDSYSCLLYTSILSTVELYAPSLAP